MTAIIDKGDTAISNGEVVSDTPGPGDKHTIKFSTSPKMSSYLVALTVGDWKCVSDHTDGVKVSVCTVPGKENLTQFPLEASKAVPALLRQLLRHQVSAAQARQHRRARLPGRRDGKLGRDHLSRDCSADR